MPSFTILPIFLLVSLLWLILKYRKSRKQSLPPGPYPWPIIGNLPQIGRKPHAALAQLAQTYGPLISVRLGSQLVIIGSTPDAAKEILKTHDRILSGRHVPHVSYAKSPQMNHVSVGWTYECTDQWKFLRTLCRTELFGTKVIESQTYLREQKVNELVQFLISKEMEEVKIAEIVFISVFNFLGNIFFSKNFINYDVENGGGMSGLIRKIVELWTTPNISDLYPILGGLDLQGLSKMAHMCFAKICSAWKGIIKERREDKYQNSTRKKDFLDVLLHNDFSDDQINYLFLEIFAAGSDTSTSTVEWAMAELLKNSIYLDKIRQELDREFSAKNAIKESDLSQLPYLQACVKETLRLHPPAPLLLPRRATETCPVMTYTIPKGTQVLVNVWAIGRDPKIWEDPLRFNPERFLDCNHELDFKGNDYEFLPFGAGRRICPGLPMAIRQVHLTLASLIHHFEWSLPDNMLPQHLDMNEKFGVTLQKEHPLVIMPRHRR